MAHFFDDLSMNIYVIMEKYGKWSKFGNKLLR